jgi:hypothetical protein
MLAIALTISLVTLLRLSKFIFELEDNVEEALDVLDQRHKKINDILQVPVTSDDPMIRSIINEIKLAREAILLVANKLVSFTLLNNSESEEEE